MKNKTFKQSIKDATMSVNPVRVARLAATRRGLKAISRLTADDVIVVSGMSPAELQGARKRTIMPDEVALYANKTFKVKVHRHDGPDSWPEIVDVSVGAHDQSNRWSDIEVVAGSKTFSALNYSPFLFRI